MGAEVDFVFQEGRSALRLTRELAAVEAADSRCGATAWLMGARQSRFHLVMARDWANRPVGFAAADARDGHITIHQVCVVDEARLRFPSLSGELIDQVIEHCATAWGDVLLPESVGLVDHLKAIGWVVVEHSPSSYRLSGAHVR